MEDSRPNPDALLASIQREDSRRQRGRLKIFFGMAPGVGKTYAMLREGRRQETEKVDVVVGLVETHGRSETQALLEGMVIAPRREVDYRGTKLEEMDLDGIIFLHPQLVLVDELAHTNAPGSRHPKRYQDVLELLDLGIDVFTTLNVQHVESRADTVRQLTGITVHETVPDSVLELAEEIELIDLSPERLRQRLAEGKVYLGPGAEAAADHFFKEENLIALREIALRLTAERVDQQLRLIRRTKTPLHVSNSGERLMVAVGSSPYSIELVRRTRRMAYTLNAKWLVVSIDGGLELSAEDQRQLDKNLALARELGAEVIFTRDSDIARALLRVARENQVTQIIAGKSLGHPWLDWLRGGSLVDRLIRESGVIDIYVMTPMAVTRASKGRGTPRYPASPWTAYAQAMAGVGIATGVNLFLVGFTGYWSIGLAYLFAILIMGLFLARGPLLLAAALSALLWDFLFIPPLYTFYIAKLEDVLMLGIFFVVALVTGQLTSRLRAEEHDERRREQRATALYRLTRRIATANSIHEVIAHAVRQIHDTFGVDCAFHLSDSAFGLPTEGHSASTLRLDEKEHGVAVWAFRNRRKAGRFTDTLPSSQALHLPVMTAGHVFGVMAIRPADEKTLGLDERDLLESFALQIALVLEKESLRDQAEQAHILARSDELHRSLFNSVSHELRTPLTVIQTATDALARSDAPLVQRLTGEINEALERLKRLVKNLLDSARLDSGHLELKREWVEVSELLEMAREMAGPRLSPSRVKTRLPDGLPLLHVDVGLLAQALANILHNAIVHGSPDGEIVIGAEAKNGSLAISITDQGVGISPELLGVLFDRFTRSSQANPGGTGLGLSIARGFIEAHGGTIEAANAPKGGAVFILRLPLEKGAGSANLAA